jgi:hypothetical protein
MRLARAQARHLDKLCQYMNAQTRLVTFDGAFGLGEVVASAVPVPGFLLVLGVLRHIHGLARNLQACDEEGARLMVYCAAMTKALAPVVNRVRPTPELTEALDRAAAALEALRDMLEWNGQRGMVERMFSSDRFRGAAEAARREVEGAVRGAMDVAQVQGVEDAAETRSMVEHLVRRRWPAARARQP